MYRISGSRLNQDLERSLWWFRYERLGFFATKIADRRLKERFGISIDDLNKNYRHITGESYYPLWIVVKTNNVQEAIKKLTKDREILKFVYGLTMPENLTPSCLVEYN